LNAIQDVTDIKSGNTKAIVNVLRFSDQLTKKDVSEQTHLSFATVSNLCNEMKERNILTDVKRSGKSVGRNPNVLSLNCDRYCMIALDMQLENDLGIAILNLRNDVLLERSYDISRLKSAEEIVRFAKRTCDACVAELGLENADFIGIGAAVPAVYDSKTGLLTLSAVDLYERAPLKELLYDAFGLPPYVDNIANIRAISIHTRFPELNNLVCMDVSQGVGVGAISEGNLIRGKNGYATEVAHVPIGDPALICPSCGGRGCVELELSLGGMVRYYPEIDRSLPLFGRWEEFVRLMRLRDEKSRRIAARIGTVSGSLASILINLFDPDTFFVTGYISDIFDLIEPSFSEQIRQRSRMSVDAGLKIRSERSDPSSSVYVGLSDTVYNLWDPLK